MIHFLLVPPGVRHMFKVLRYFTVFAAMFRELAIMLTVRCWNSEFE